MCQALREIILEVFADMLEEREAKGIRKGIEQGFEQAMNFIILNMRANNYSLQQISVITDKSVREVKKALNGYNISSKRNE